MKRSDIIILALAVVLLMMYMHHSTHDIVIVVSILFLFAFMMPGGNGKRKCNKNKAKDLEGPPMQLICNAGSGECYMVPVPDDGGYHLSQNAAGDTGAVAYPDPPGGLTGAVNMPPDYGQVLYGQTPYNHAKYEQVLQQSLNYGAVVSAFADLEYKTGDARMKDKALASGRKGQNSRNIRSKMTKNNFSDYFQDELKYHDQRFGAWIERDYDKDKYISGKSQLWQ